MNIRDEDSASPSQISVLDILHQHKIHIVKKVFVSRSITSTDLVRPTDQVAPLHHFDLLVLETAYCLAWQAGSSHNLQDRLAMGRPDSGDIELMNHRQEDQGAVEEAHSSVASRNLATAADFGSAGSVVAECKIVGVAVAEDVVTDLVVLD